LHSVLAKKDKWQQRATLSIWDIARLKAKRLLGDKHEIPSSDVITSCNHLMKHKDSSHPSANKLQTQICFTCSVVSWFMVARLWFAM